MLKVVKKLFGSLSEDEVDVLLDVLNGEDDIECCDKVMLEVFYVIGLCVSEFIGFRMFQISLIQGLVRVIGKGNKE